MTVRKALGNVNGERKAGAEMLELACVIDDV